MPREEFNIATNDSADGSYSSAQQWRGHIDVRTRDGESVDKSFTRRRVGCGFSVLCVCMLVVMVFAIVLLCIGFIVVYENEGQVVATVDLFAEELPPEQAVWFESNLAELRNAFRVVEENKKRAKNVVLFVALDSVESLDGDTRPIWESFPHLALLRPTMQEQHARASFNPTSMFCGIETHPHTIGFDSAVKPWEECVSTPNSTHHAASIVQWAQTVGRRTGVVTNGEIVQPFPAALYAHAPNASWLHSAPDALLCPDVRSQLLHGETGRQLNVIAGTLNCPDEFCREAFGAEWVNNRLEDRSTYKLSKDMSDLINPNLRGVEYALGLYDQQSLAGPTAFYDLIVGALAVLESPEGFLLVAIADPKVPVSGSEFNSAVRATLRKLSGTLDDSLIVVVRSDARDVGSAFATVHAIGPMSHLLHRVHNQTFLAHFISYAARIGRFRDADLTNLILQII